MRHLSVKGLIALINISVLSTLVGCSGSSGGGSDEEIAELCNQLASANKSITVPSGYVAFDDFEYVVERGTSINPDTPLYTADVVNPFVENGPWTRAKAENITGSAHGLLYTTDSIPGYPCEAFPGTNSSRVLAMESLDETFNQEFGTTLRDIDYYLQLGEPDNAHTNYIPANVWFQFWVYTNDYGDQRSEFHTRFKFLYPCNTSYPCRNDSYIDPDNQGLGTTGTPGYNWLFSFGHTSSAPFWENNNEEDKTRIYFRPAGPDYNSPTITVHNQSELDPNLKNEIGQTNADEYIIPNRWTLVKINFNTSGSTGSYEAWIRPIGTSTWTQVAEWLHGNNNFSWDVIPYQPGENGHRVLKMPSTVEYYDSWIYMDDFVMAENEADLPEYPY